MNLEELLEALTTASTCVSRAAIDEGKGELVRLLTVASKKLQEAIAELEGEEEEDEMAKLSHD